MLKIVFLSKDNLTTNPRLKKELFLADGLQLETLFVGFDLKNWSESLEEEVKYNLQNVKLIYLPASRKNKSLLWLISVFIEKISRVFTKFFSRSLFLQAFAENRRTFLLWLYGKFFIRFKPDIVVGHTLATFYPAYVLAKRFGAKLIFDIEDFHPGEGVKDPDSEIYKRRAFLMSRLLPKAHRITYASPLIGRYSLRLVKSWIVPPNYLILNSFSKSFFVYKDIDDNKLQLVWFSQNIAEGRGLELLVPVVYEFRDKVHLTLIGNLYPNYWEKFLSRYSEALTVLKPLPEEELYKQLSNYDVGCALELSIDINKDICWSNKIFAYAQSGLFILATNTKAQLQFLSEHPNLGISVMQFINDFRRKVLWLIEHKEEIRANKARRFEYAKQFAWENEAKKIEQIWYAVLKSRKQLR